VLKTLAMDGLEAVHDWNGMFAVAAWDRHEKRLLLIRDRVGVKPLYYYWDGKTFLFASEIKAILASELVPRRINQQAVWDYLTFSVGFDEGGYYSELPYARQVAQHVSANYHEVIIGQEKFLEMLPEVVYYLDEPLADLPAIPLLAVSRLARQHVKVVLSGEG